MDLISEFIFCETNEEGKSTKVINETIFILKECFD